MPGLSVRMTLEVAETVERLRQWSARGLVDARDVAVREALIASLQAAVEATPVRSGRARAAWVHGIETLGGEPPAQWTGPAPETAAIAAGEARGSVTSNHSATVTTIEARNEVPYLPLIEFGAARRPPRSMLRPALLAARQVLRVAFLTRLEEVRP